MEDELIKRHPSSFHVYFDKIGMVCYQMHKWNKAIDYLSKAIEAEHQEAQYYYHRSMVLADIRKTGEAIDDIRKAIEISPMPEYCRQLAQLQGE